MTDRQFVIAEFPKAYLVRNEQYRKLEYIVKVRNFKVLNYLGKGATPEIAWKEAKEYIEKVQKHSQEMERVK